MPIECTIEPQSMDHEEYRLLDYQVTGLIFETHRLLGRLHDERVYQTELLRSCYAAGLIVETEVPITITFKDFSKSYFMDLVVENSIDYELKTADSLTNRHKSQCLNYLMLSGLQFGKLANFRPPSVQLHHLRNGVASADRYSVQFEYDQWKPISTRCSTLREAVEEIVQDWGGFLEVNLYYEGLCHLLGGEGSLVRNVKISRDGHDLGAMKATLLDSVTALELTGFREYVDGYSSQLIRKYKYTSVKHVQWVNFEGQIVSFRTLTL